MSSSVTSDAGETAAAAGTSGKASPTGCRGSRDAKHVAFPTWHNQTTQLEFWNTTQKQNSTKQNKTKQNKTKQNTTKRKETKRNGGNSIQHPK
jgi:hypothetical protein